MRKPLWVLWLSACCLSASAVATEHAELDQAIRQLESAKHALRRAEQAVKSLAGQTRIYFDYRKARNDIDLVIQGVKAYTNGNRAQPRDPRQIRTLSGEYDKVRAK